MELLKSKWFLFTAIPVLIFVVLLLIGKKSAHAEIEIPANAKTVWKVLTNIREAKEWNTVLVPIEGDLKIGSNIKYSFQQEGKEAYEIPAEVIKIEEGKLINQKGGMPLVLTFNHKYILEENGDSCKLIIHEDYAGVMVPFWNHKPVEEAYKNLADQIKERTLQIANLL